MDVIKPYVAGDALVAHHIGTFNHLLSHGLQTIVNREAPIVGKQHVVRLGYVSVDRPKYVRSDRTVVDAYPNHARKNNSTYEGVISIGLSVDTIGGGRCEYPRVPIGKLPIMVRSSACNLTTRDPFECEECSNDVGGYFIVKGKERALIGQLRTAYNKVYVFEAKPSEKKYRYYSEIRTMNPAGASVLVKAVVDERGRCYFSLPYIKNFVPAGAVFRALDEPFADVERLIRAADRSTRRLREQYDRFDTARQAIEFLASCVPEERDDSVAYVESILSNELFYHIGSLTPSKCALHLAYSLRRLLAVADGVVGLRCDDKHSLTNKRVDSSGNLVAFLFNGLLKQFVKLLHTKLNEEPALHPLFAVEPINVMSYGFSSCFMSSKWTTQKSSNAYSREGVSSVLSVQNYGARISQLRRVMLPNGVKGKVSNARRLHASQFSFLCPYETPEGEKVGLINNLSLGVDVTVDVPSHETLVVLLGIDSFRPDDTDGKILVSLNGRLIGSTDNAASFVREFKAFRRSDALDDRTSIAWQRYADEIHVWSDEGRLVRPVLDVETRCVVYRDVEELEQSVVAADASDERRNKCEYAEICPAATMMSVMASVIPLANHSQSPRNAYQSAMGKQAIGVPVESFLYRYDTTLHTLHYPQKPITRSEMVNVLRFDEMSHGTNVVVAVLSFEDNQEDSVILNKSSIDRGLFVSTTYKTIVEEERKQGNSDFQCIRLPKTEYRRHDVNYSHLDLDGIVKRDSTIRLRAGDAIIGKTINRTVVNKETGCRSLETKDATIVVKPGEEGFVDAVSDETNADGTRVVKIRLRVLRTPEIGDKFVSSAAQKGTCGMIYRQEDMPFDADGVVPDLIINPHAIPSRMTINMLVEMCFSSIGCRSGSFQDATTFAHPDIETELADKLRSVGLEEYRTQLYSGTTGRKYAAKSFMAPAFYQRLKHLVSDKIHARVTGPLDVLTHQPVAGRSRDGGMRFGTMECDATLASGASRMLKEFMYDKSDKYRVFVCERCGQIPFSNDYCQTCRGAETVEKTTPYATKLLYQLLQGMGVKIKLG